MKVQKTPFDILQDLKRSTEEQAPSPSISHILKEKGIEFVPDIVEQESVLSLAKNVGKLCVFSDKDNREPICQATVIHLSETNDLFVTAKHVIYPKYSPGGHSLDKRLIYVHFGIRPLIPGNRRMEKSGWIQLKLLSYDSIESPPLQLECGCYHDRIFDFIFLEKQELNGSQEKQDQTNSQPPIDRDKLISHARLQKGDEVALIGFFDTNCTGTLEDFFTQTGLSELPKHNGDRIKKVLIEKREFHKLVSYQRGPMLEACRKHTCIYDCISAGGFSGGIVASQRNKCLCGMHIGQIDEDARIGITVCHFLESCPRIQGNT